MSAIPSRIGPYQVLELLGEGGMGRVFLARQSAPVEREVAVKLLVRGQDSGRVLERFRQEQQALARMNHPGIARVLDAGEDEQGRPWFAMEYVQGEPITGYCDRHELSPDERVALCIELCDALQHAHQKGVIHRDLKPANVLVEHTGDRARPKIIDFGVARATGWELAQREHFTEFGQLLGTPEYMSPEQAEMGEGGIDTRTDVYSVGVLLYELLSGSLPFDSKSLRERGLTEIHRILREEDPPLPSSRASSLGEGDDRRRVDPHVLAKQLRGDLDWIVMKAMEKDPARRYASASELAADLKRHLDDEPVLAARPGALYRWRKFARRHRVGVAAGAAAALALLLGAGVASWQAVRATRAEQDAQRQAELAGATRDYLLGVFGQADPSVNPLGRETSVQEALDRAADELGGRFGGDPGLEASIRATLGEAYLSMGEFGPAAQQLERSRELFGEGPASLDDERRRAAARWARVLRWRGDHTGARDELEAALSPPPADDDLHAQLLVGLAHVRADQGELAAADSLAARATQLAPTRALRLAHADILSRRGQHDEAAAMVRAELARATGADSLAWWRGDALGTLVGIELDAGEVEAARRSADELLALRERTLGPAHPATAHALRLRTEVEEDAGRFDLALQLAAEAHARLAAALGPTHPLVLSAIEKRGLSFSLAGQPDSALACLQLAVDGRRERLGEEHPDVARARSNLGGALAIAGRSDEAREQFALASASLEAAYGARHPHVLEMRRLEADNLQRSGDPRAAVALGEEILRRATEGGMGREHPVALRAEADLAKALDQLGEHDRAQEHHRHFLRVHERRFPQGHPDQATVYNNLGASQQAQGDLDAAVVSYRRALEMNERLIGSDHPDNLFPRNNLAALLRESGACAQAESLFALVVEDFTRIFGEAHPNVAATTHNHGYALLCMGELEEAEAEIRRAIAIGEGVLPPGHLYLQIFRSSLGLCLARQGRHGEAQQELESSYASLAAQLGEGHERARKVAGYLREACELAGDAAGAASWGEIEQRG